MTLDTYSHVMAEHRRTKPVDVVLRFGACSVARGAQAEFGVGGPA